MLKPKWLLKMQTVLDWHNYINYVDALDEAINLDFVF